MADFASGLSAGLEVRRYEEGSQDRELARRERQQRIDENSLGLDMARRQSADDLARRKIVEDATTEPVIKDFDASDNPQTVERRQRVLSPSEQLDLHERLGEHDMKTGRMSADQSLGFREKVRNMETEGAFDAYNEYRRSGDVKAATRMFNKRGQSRVDESQPIREVKRKDPTTGMEYSAYQAMSPEGKPMTFDPLQTAREVGGAKSWLDQQKTAFEAKKSAALDKRNETADRRVDLLEEEGRRKSARDDDRYFLESRKLDIAEKNGGKEGGGGVFGYRMRWLQDNMPTLSSEQRYTLATGQRSIPEAQIRKWAEDAVSRQEKLTGIPVKPEDRKRAVDEKATFLRGMRGQGGEPQPGAGPAKPAAAPRDYSNLWN